MASRAVAGASEGNCNNNDSVIIEIPMEMEPELTSRKNIIYRVPRKLRKLQEDAYTPNLISIGPFHHGKRELRAMEHHKKRYYERFLTRITKKDVDLDTFIKGQRGAVQNSYAGTTGFEKKDSEFEEMILRDACFIIELFLTNHEYLFDKEKKEKKDYILRTEWLKKAIKLDLILLENQLPYFLFKELFQATKPKYERTRRVNVSSKPEDSERPTSSSSNPGGTPDNEDEFLQLAYDFFIDFCTRSPKTDAEILDEINESNKKTDGSDKKMKKIKHFTDLVRQFRLPKNPPETNSENGDNHLYSATELDKAGVSFVVNDGARLTDVNFTSKCYGPPLIKLPALMLDGATELLFRNIIALEQCIYSDEAYICNYVLLMSQLINTKEDAEFLVEKKIIKNLSSHEVDVLLTSLGNETSATYFYHARDCERLNEYYDNGLNRTLTKAKKVYFNDLWKTSSTVVGFFVLFFTITQLVKDIFFSQERTQEFTLGESKIHIF